jgi:choline dehydrogenase-like flavoprotein
VCPVDGRAAYHSPDPAEAAQLHFSDLDWKYFTTPQAHLDGKPKYNCAVKALSGGSVINTGGWIRGDKRDYNAWAEEVGDLSWSYDGLLPYFKRSEKHFDPKGDAEQHGFDGPVRTASVSASGRKFPLREDVMKLWGNLEGMRYVEDANGGSPQGIAELVENWADGKRQVASEVYGLGGVEVVTGTLVRRVVFEGTMAVGVEFESGVVRKAKRGGQVVVCAGAYRTPQVLLWVSLSRLVSRWRT